MKQVYITTVPLQGGRDLAKVTYSPRNLSFSIVPETRFPIVMVMDNTRIPREADVLVIAIRMSNGDTAKNYGLLLEELTQRGVSEEQVKMVQMEENQKNDNLMSLFSAIVEAIPEDSLVYTDITYGTKSIPLIELSALTYTEQLKRHVEVNGIFYGELVFENGKPTNRHSLYNLTSLYTLSNLIHTAAYGSSNPKALVDEVLQAFHAADTQQDD